MARRVPTLSLKQYTDGRTADRVQFTQELFSGIKQYGFIIIKDHPIAPQLLDLAYLELESFFALPAETKLRYTNETGDTQRGYTPFGKEHAKNSQVHDLKEFWHIGRDLPAGHPFHAHYPKNVWPDNLPQFRKTLQMLYSELDIVGDIILESLTEPLCLEKNYFSKMVRDGNNILRLLHYPPLQDGVDPRCIRAAAHEDINLLTILVAATTTGLELLDRDGHWLAVEAEKNELVVDAGDMMARITNNVIPATTHRVVNPPDGGHHHRYSMPFFIHPNPDALLKCIDSCRGEKALFEPIGAQEFLLQRLREIGMVASKPSKLLM